MRSRSAGVASIGTRSLSCRFTPQAPISPSTDAISLGGMVRRTASPNGARPRLPSVHNPKENFCSGLGWLVPFDLLMDSSFVFAVTLSSLRWIQRRRRRRNLADQAVLRIFVQLLYFVQFLFRVCRFAFGLIQAA